MSQKIRIVTLGDITDRLHRKWLKDPKQRQAFSRERRLLFQLVNDTRLGKIAWNLIEGETRDDADPRKALVIAKVTGVCDFQGIYQDGSRVRLHYCCCGTHVYAEVTCCLKGKRQETFLPSWAAHKEFWHLLDTVRNQLRMRMLLRTLKRK